MLIHVGLRFCFSGLLLWHRVERDKVMIRRKLSDRPQCRKAFVSIHSLGMLKQITLSQAQIKIKRPLWAMEEQPIYLTAPQHQGPFQTVPLLSEEKWSTIKRNWQNNLESNEHHIKRHTGEPCSFVISTSCLSIDKEVLGMKTTFAVMQGSKQRIQWKVKRLMCIYVPVRYSIELLVLHGRRVTDPPIITSKWLN